MGQSGAGKSVEFLILSHLLMSFINYNKGRRQILSDKSYCFTQRIFWLRLSSVPFN
jgi:hypothetical protein